MREMKNRLKVLLKRRRPGDFTVPFTTDTYLTENIDSMAIIPPKTEEKLRSVSYLHWCHHHLGKDTLGILRG